MNQKVCDFCSEIIRNKVFYLAVTEAVLPREEDKLTQFISAEEAFRFMNQNQQELRKGTQYFEVCEGCKKVIHYLMNIRQDQLKQMKNEAEGILRLPYLDGGRHGI